MIRAIQEISETTANPQITGMRIIIPMAEGHG